MSGNDMESLTFVRLEANPGRRLWPGLCVLLLLGVFLSAGARGVSAGDDSYFPDSPILRPEVGAHTAPINRIAVDRAERFLVSGSHDKTARVWDLATGQLLRTLRVPLGEGRLGQILSIAISPDGATIAVGGFTGPRIGTNSIFIFERETGRLRQRIGQLANVIHHLVYSHDGLLLAATLGLKNGLQVYETVAYTEIGRDTDYGDSSYWADFDGGGRLATSSLDGQLRLYKGNFSQPIHKRAAPCGKQPFGIAFSPDSEKLIVGCTDTIRVDVVSATDLSPLFAVDTENLGIGVLAIVAWSQDGRFVYGAGTYDDGGPNPVLRWDQSGRRDAVSFRRATDTVMDLAPLSDGRLAIGATDLLAVLEPSGEVVWEHSSPRADFRDLLGEDGLLVSRDGSVVAFGFEYGGQSRARFSLTEAELRLSPTRTDSLKSALTEFEGLAITHWRNRTDPKLNGELLALDNYEKSRSLAIAVDGKRYLLGTEWRLRLFDRQGEELDQIEIPGVAWAVNLTVDGRMAVAAFYDGTIRWYEIVNNKLHERLALFPQQDGRWIAWTPQGFFDAGNGGESLVGYHLNRGADTAPDFVGIERLYDLYYRPDLIVAAFAGETNKLDAALALIGDVRKVLADLPPKLHLTSPTGVSTEESEYTLSFTLEDRGGELARIEYRINGVVIEPPTGRLSPVKGPQGQPLYRQPLPLQPGPNILEVRSISAAGVVSEPVVAEVAYSRPSAAQRSFYGIVIGIDDYRDSVLQLTYAANDAKAFKAALEARGAGLFAKVDITLLTNQQATIEGIKAAFEQIKPKVGIEDAFVLYLAGHGRSLDGRYHFLPWEFIYETDDTVREHSLNQEMLRQLLESIPAQRGLLVFDTCESGEAIQLAAARGGLQNKAAIARLMKATGRAAIAASTSQQQALEGYKNHGVFTFAVLEALGAVESDGRGPAAPADPNGDGFIDVDELFRHVFESVPDITQHLWQREQFPQRQSVGEPFVIGTVPAQ